MDFLLSITWNLSLTWKILTYITGSALIVHSFVMTHRESQRERIRSCPTSAKTMPIQGFQVAESFLYTWALPPPVSVIAFTEGIWSYHWYLDNSHGRDRVWQQRHHKKENQVKACKSLVYLRYWSPERGWTAKKQPQPRRKCQQRLPTLHYFTCPDVVQVPSKRWLTKKILLRWPKSERKSISALSLHFPFPIFRENNLVISTFWSACMCVSWIFACEWNLPMHTIVHAVLRGWDTHPYTSAEKLEILWLLFALCLVKVGDILDHWQPHSTCGRVSLCRPTVLGWRKAWKLVSFLMWQMSVIG